MQLTWARPAHDHEHPQSQEKMKPFFQVPTSWEPLREENGISIIINRSRNMLLENVWMEIMYSNHSKWKSLGNSLSSLTKSGQPEGTVKASGARSKPNLPRHLHPELRLAVQDRKRNIWTTFPTDVYLLAVSNLLEWNHCTINPDENKCFQEIRIHLRVKSKRKLLKTRQSGLFGRDKKSNDLQSFSKTMRLFLSYKQNRLVMGGTPIMQNNLRFCTISYGA